MVQHYNFMQTWVRLKIPASRFNFDFLEFDWAGRGGLELKANHFRLVELRNNISSITRQIMALTRICFIRALSVAVTDDESGWPGKQTLI